MQCPVCNSVARDRTPPDYDGIVVGCVSCGNFEIAPGYLDKLRALDPSARSEILRNHQTRRRWRTRRCSSWVRWVPR